MLFWFNKSASSISARINEPYPFNPGDKKVNKVFDVINTSTVQPGLLFRSVCGQECSDKKTECFVIFNNYRGVIKRKRREFLTHGST